MEQASPHFLTKGLDVYSPVYADAFASPIRNNIIRDMLESMTTPCLLSTQSKQGESARVGDPRTGWLHSPPNCQKVRKLLRTTVTTTYVHQPQVREKPMVKRWRRNRIPSNPVNLGRNTRNICNIYISKDVSHLMHTFVSH